MQLQPTCINYQLPRINHNKIRIAIFNFRQCSCNELYFHFMPSFLKNEKRQFSSFQKRNLNQQRSGTRARWRKKFHQVGEDKQFYRAGNTCLKCELSKVKIKHRNHLHTPAPPSLPFIDFILECTYDKSWNFDDTVELVFAIIFIKTIYFLDLDLKYSLGIEDLYDNTVDETSGK